MGCERRRATSWIHACPGPAAMLKSAGMRARDAKPAVRVVSGAGVEEDAPTSSTIVGKLHTIVETSPTSVEEFFANFRSCAALRSGRDQEKAPAKAGAIKRLNHAKQIIDREQVQARPDHRDRRQHHRASKPTARLYHANAARLCRLRRDPPGARSDCARHLQVTRSCRPMVEVVAQL
jgi:hypothetical protein